MTYDTLWSFEIRYEVSLIFDLYCRGNFKGGCVFLVLGHKSCQQVIFMSFGVMAKL